MFQSFSPFGGGCSRGYIFSANFGSNRVNFSFVLSMSRFCRYGKVMVVMLLRIDVNHMASRHSKKRVVRTLQFGITECGVGGLSCISLVLRCLRCLTGALACGGFGVWVSVGRRGKEGFGGKGERLMMMVVGSVLLCTESCGEGSLEIGTDCREWPTFWRFARDLRFLYADFTLGL